MKTDKIKQDNPKSLNKIDYSGERDIVSIWSFIHIGYTGNKAYEAERVHRIIKESWDMTRRKK